METQLNSTHLTELEQNQITAQIEEDLVEHAYKSSPSATLVACVTSIATLLFFYNYTNNKLLWTWFISFNIILVYFVCLNIAYRKLKFKLSYKTWNWFLSPAIAICAGYWGSTGFFDPQDFVHQFVLLSLVLIAAGSFSMVTVGTFKFCILCVSLTLIPTVVWFFLQPSLYYKLGGLFLICYAFFLMGVNRSSTEWLRNSLKLKIENSLITHQASHDLLTDLPNQRALTVYIDNLITENNSFAIVCMSVNRLEMFSNSLGYQASDLIMLSLAKRLKTLIGESQFTAHGKVKYILTHPRSDSFTILIAPIKIEQMEKEIKRLFMVLDVPFHLDNREAKLTTSIGVSLYPVDGSKPANLLTNAYAAMFQAKSKGGNQVEFYTLQFNEETPYLLELESDLHQALRKKEFFLDYQPIIDLNTATVAGAEALIRWKHPKHGLVQPFNFIPLAEETGLISSLGTWVIEEVVRQKNIWREAGNISPSLKISINISGKQLKNPKFLEDLQILLDNNKIDGGELDFELTETAFLNESFAPILKEIVRKKITLSIDDFGTGFSGFSYLKHFDIDKIKIDKSFVGDLMTNEESATIVSSIIAMARELKIKALAEGVETMQQVKFLKEKGCQFVQGFLFSKPISAEEFTKFLTSDHVKQILT